jgi:hypothetical protein
MNLVKLWRRFESLVGLRADFSWRRRYLSANEPALGALGQGPGKPRRKKPKRVKKKPRRVLKTRKKGSR